jgi:hypothetical protein
MTTTRNIKRAAVTFLIALLAASVVNAQNSRHENNRDDRGNQNRTTRLLDDHGKHVRKEKKVVSVPEPGAIALLSTGLAALGLRLILRRRRD